MPEDVGLRAAVSGLALSAFGRHDEMTLIPVAVGLEVPPGMMAIAPLDEPLKARRALRVGFAHEHQVLQLGGDVVGQFLQAVEERDLGNVDACGAPLLPGCDRARIEHARVEREHRIHQFEPVCRHEILIVGARIGPPVLRAPATEVAGGPPEHAAESRRVIPARAGAHEIQKIRVVLLDQLRLPGRAVRRDKAPRPEVMPPLRGFGCQRREALGLGDLQVGDRPCTDVIVRIETRRTRDEHGEPARARRRRELDRGFVAITRARRSPDDADRHRGRVMKLLLAKLLRQHDAPVANVEPRRRGVLRRLDHHGVILRQLKILTGVPLDRVAQHAQIHVNCRRLLASVFDLHRHDVAVRPAEHAGRHSPALRGHRAIVDGKMLREGGCPRRRRRPHPRG